MRTIKFRGKRIDNNEWVEGSLAYFFDNPQNAMIMPKCYFGTRDFGDEDSSGKPVIENELALGGFINIIPETVGQFTGLTDKNGKEIFEGDIIQFKYADKIEENGFAYNKGVVVFENSSFVVKEPGFNYDYEDESRIPDTLYYWLASENCYVIGNIHDNPELL